MASLARPYAAFVSDPQPPVPPARGETVPPPAGESAPPPLKPLDPPTVPFAIGGMIVWLIAWIVIYFGFRHDHPSWPDICVAGFFLGFPGLAVMIVHDRNRRARRKAATASNVG
jgi:hypothetical protein